MNERQEVLRRVRRVVVKVGSAVIAPAGLPGIDEERIAAIANQIAELRKEGLDTVLVSSGAIASGIRHLGLKARPRTIPLKQAAAAVGQSRLIWSYERAFAPHGVRIAQILLTREDLQSRARFLNSRNTLLTLLSHGVLPIINENDTVAVEEIQFGDNDTLAGMVTGLVDAQLLVILSDVPGLCTADPRAHRDARLIDLVPKVTPEIERVASGVPGHEGRGGMQTKLLAARRAASRGVATVIADGRAPDTLRRLMAGEPVGTLFLPAPGRIRGRKHWIATTLAVRGRLRLDRGAAAALSRGGKSLLPSGVVGVEGRFAEGDAVVCLDPDGHEIAKGLVNYGAEEIARIKGLRTSQIAEALGRKFSDEIIHRDNLVLLDSGEPRT